MGLQIQPEAFEAFYDKVGKLARGMGYFARFLVTQPDSTQGTRFFEEPPKGMPGLTAFNARAAQLLDLLPTHMGPDGKLCPREVNLDGDPAVKAAWVGYFDSVEEDLGRGRELYDVQDAASKSADNAARIYGIYRVFDYDAEVVPNSHMVNATVVARWFLNEARRFRKTTAIPEGVRRAIQLEKFMCDYCLEHRTTCVPTREVSQKGPDATRYKQPRDEAFEMLTDHGRGWPAKDGQKTFYEVDANVLRKYRDG